LGLIGISSWEALVFSDLLHACWYVPMTLAGGIALEARGARRVRSARTDRMVAAEK
jgi:hypothetical protein